MLSLLALGPLQRGEQSSAIRHCGRDSKTSAMVGSANLVVAWQSAFCDYGVKVGQILLTHRDITADNGHIKHAINEAIRARVVPIINENDILSDIELAKLSYGGDNDGLAARIATLIKSKHVLLLTNVDGLLDNNGRLIKFVNKDNYHVCSNYIGEKSKLGRGGMLSKINAAMNAHDSGVEAHIGLSTGSYRKIINKLSGTHIG